MQHSEELTHTPRVRARARARVRLRLRLRLRLRVRVRVRVRVHTHGGVAAQHALALRLPPAWSEALATIGKGRLDRGELGRKEGPHGAQPEAVRPVVVDRESGLEVLHLGEG